MDSSSTGAPSEPPPSQTTTLSVHALVSEHTDLVYRAVRRAGLEGAAAEDAAQQVFMVATRRIGVVESGKEKGFLFATALKVAAQLRRKQERAREVEFSEESSMNEALAHPYVGSLEEQLDQRRACMMLDEVLAAMPEKFREVFVLSELEDLSGAEVAACLDVPQGTVSSRLIRARELFEQNLRRLRARRGFGKLD